MAGPRFDADLLRRFVESFGVHDDLQLSHDDPMPPELDAGHDDSPYAFPLWRPAAIATDRAALEAMYATMPGPLPPLYEQLVLSYRWLEVYLGDFGELLANPPGPGLAGLAAAITADPVFVHVLFPQGLVPFGRASESYDPICFDTTRRLPDGDCPIIRIEHESVLCDLRIGDSWPVSNSFRAFVEVVVRTGS